MQIRQQSNSEMVQNQINSTKYLLELSLCVSTFWFLGFRRIHSLHLEVLFKKTKMQLLQPKCNI